MPQSGCGVPWADEPPGGCGVWLTQREPSAPSYGRVASFSLVTGSRRLATTLGPYAAIRAASATPASHPRPSALRLPGAGRAGCLSGHIVKQCARELPPLPLKPVPVARSRKLVRSSTLDACSSVSDREGDICVALAPGWRVRVERLKRFGSFCASKGPPTGLTPHPAAMALLCNAITAFGLGRHPGAWAQRSAFLKSMDRMLK